MDIKRNQVTLLGRVGWKDFKYTENGNAIATINLGVKRGQDNWNNFFIKFFNTKMKMTAEEIAEFVKEGDYIQVTGRLVESKFKPQGSDKEVSKIEIIGSSYKFVQFNEELQEFEFSDGSHG